METIDFTEPSAFILTTIFMFLGIFGRYAGISLIFSLLIKGMFKAKFASREVQTRPRRLKQTYIEIGWSLITSLFFAFAGTLMVILWQKGYTKVYLDWNTYSGIWFVISILLLLFLHETYYYWLHRWMHHPKIYRYVHKVHHDSITTSAWTSFSFHPYESVLQAIFIPVMTFIIPLHYVAIGIVLVIMTTTSVINHLNTELYPQDFNRNWFGRWWIGATHHSLHHSQFRYNYGLYFTFWDRWMNTESPDFIKLFDKKTSPIKPK
jgi:sterol desaturase/sphingolipid hydroxylase (fatty acid hydroxylase superfamily)